MLHSNVSKSARCPAFVASLESSPFDSSPRQLLEWSRAAISYPCHPEQISPKQLRVTLFNKTQMDGFFGSHQDPSGMFSTQQSRFFPTMGLREETKESLRFVLFGVLQQPGPWIVWSPSCSWQITLHNAWTMLPPVWKRLKQLGPAKS